MNRGEPPKPSSNILDTSSKEKPQRGVLGSSQPWNFRVQEDSVRGEYVPTSWTLGFNANLPKIALSYISQCTFAENQLCAAHYSKCRMGRAIARNTAQT